MNKSLKYKLMLYIIPTVAISLILSVFITTKLVSSNDRELAYNSAFESARKYANDLNSELQNHVGLVASLANTMQAYKSDNRDEVTDMVKQILVSSHLFISNSMCYEPNKFDGNDNKYKNKPRHDSTGRFIPYWVKSANGIVFDKLTGYEDPASDWYSELKKTKQLYFTKPILYNGALIVSVCLPILKNNEFIGGAYGDMALNFLDSEVGKIKIFESGYAFLVSKEGSFIASREKELIGNKSLYDLAEIKKEPKYKELADNMKAGIENPIQMKDPQTGKDVVLFPSTVKTTGWEMVMVVPVDEMLAGAFAVRNWLLIVGLIILALIAISIFYITTKMTRPITQALNMMNELSKGHLGAMVHTDSKDEIGLMINAMNDFTRKLQTEIVSVMKKIAAGDLSAELKPIDEEDEITPALITIIESLKWLNDEAVKLSQAAIAGKLEVRGNTEKFTGAYKEIISGFNDTLDALITPLNKAGDYVDDLSKGIVSVRITDDYKGDFNKIKNNLNSLIDIFNNFAVAQADMAKKHDEGAIYEIMPAEKFPGIYSQMAKSINELVNSHIDVNMRIVDIVGRYGQGDFSINMEKLPGEKIKITEAVDKVKSSLMDINSEIVNLANEAVKGNLSVRGDETKFQFGFKDMVAGINRTLEALINPLNMAADYVDNLSQGIIPEKITDNYNGEFNQIKNNLNSLINIFDGFEKAQAEMARKHDEGSIHEAISTEKFPGAFNTMAKSINNLVMSHIKVNMRVIDIVGQYGQGNFSEDMDRLPGEKAKITEAVSLVKKNLLDINTEIINLSKEAIKGNLSARGNSGKFQYSLKEMVDGINNTLDALIDPINMAVTCIDKIGKGEIPAKITDAYNGDFNKLKNNLNLCIDAINALVSDTKALAFATKDGNLSLRTDTTKFDGDYKIIVESINHTLDSIVTPIREGVAVLEEMANGDLTALITGDFKGDYQMIKNSINTVSQSLNKALNDVNDAVEATASASNQISSSTEEMASGSQEQTQQAIEAAGAVEEMTKTIMENTKNASFAADTAKEAGNKAEQGGKVVRETIEGMNRIAEVVRKSSVIVNELGKSSNQIGEIVQVIDDIADQTNLLALNAAIEAARAGEQGRGFAVVADEVRKLAERTTKATKEIAVMIRTIQKDTKEAVSSMEQGTKEVEAGKHKADLAGEALLEIIEGAKQVVDIVSQVAAASEEQSTAAEEISKSIDAMSSVTQESATGTQQIAHAAEDLNRLTLNLETLINRFKISNAEPKRQLQNSGAKGNLTA